LGLFLQSLRDGGPAHAVEPASTGFAIVPKPGGDPQAFNDLARETLNRAGSDYAAFPRTDGRSGYDQVIVIPIE